jgi:hypothetical protein
MLVMSVSGLQAAAIVVGLVGLGFFAFATAYYFRNRRIALAARERLNEDAQPSKPSTSQDASGGDGPAGQEQ